MIRGRRPTAVGRGSPIHFGLVAGAAMLAAGGLGAQGAVTVATADTQSVAGWDVTRARGQTREIDFTTSEGTWMSVDISPDGKWIVFDLLGHVYRVPSAGGEAESLTQGSGVAVNYHPRYSPDGGEIAFVSDRGGQNNLWVMKADGSDPRPVFTDMETQIVEPAWTPDGRAIVATRRFQVSSFYVKSDRIWMFPRDGGPPVQVVGAGRAQWPSVSPDGRYVYFHISPQQGRDYRLERIDLANGTRQRVTSGEPILNTAFWFYPAGPREVAPELSPDGRWLAFARKVPGGAVTYRGVEYGPRTALWLRDLRTGDERIVMDPVTSDAMDFLNNHKLRVFPGYSWAKDGKSLVVSQGGKIRRVWIEDGRVETIPFRARVRRTISQQARTVLRIPTDSFDVRAARWPASSPDGRRLVFEAVGQLWLKELPNGRPRPLTSAAPDDFELMPSWSPDGQWVVYATWNDEHGGHVWKVRPGGRPQRLTQQTGEYLHPSWTPDGRWIVANRWTEALSRPTGDARGDMGWELVRLSAAGGAAEVVRSAGPLVKVEHGPLGMLAAAARGSGAAPRAGVASPYELAVRLRGADSAGRLALPIVGDPPNVQPSPDGRWIASQQKQNIYLSPASGVAPPLAAQPGGGASGAGAPAGAPAGPRRLTTEGGAFPRWRNATTLEWVSAGRYFAYHADGGRFDTVDIGLRLPRDIPRGTIALTGARVVTLDDRTVVENGTVVVRGSRIACVGACDTRGVDRGVDLGGKTIIPGFVDLHTHYLSQEPEGRVWQHRASSARYLAYGVTTTNDPGSSTPEVAFAIGEMVEAGRIVGPRTTNSEHYLRGWGDVQQIDSLAEAVRTVNRLADRGAVRLKIYHPPYRAQRQMIIEAARRRGVTVTTEGHDLGFLLGAVMDGAAGWEHWLQYVPIYGDVATFFGQAKAHYSAQLYRSGYGHLPGVEYWLSRSDLWRDPKVQRFSPWQQTVSKRVFSNKPLREYSFPILAQGIADIKKAGGYVAVGSHTEQEGLDTHWEVWSFALAMPPMDALEGVSMHGAHFLGLENEIGSITAGKLADLMVLNANPLDDIRNTAAIAYVMKAGTLYDANTLHELWPRRKPYGARPWYVADVLRADTRADDQWDRR